MITDLLRNDLGKVCEYGSVQVPELVRLERFRRFNIWCRRWRVDCALTKHTFRLSRRVFPGGSVTGAPKIRAMEIIDELEPMTRGPYTGAIGYLGFNRESQLSITIARHCAKTARHTFTSVPALWLIQVQKLNTKKRWQKPLASAPHFNITMFRRRRPYDRFPKRQIRS